MSTPRLLRRAAVGVALLAVFVLAASVSPGQRDKKDKKPETKTGNTVKITHLLGDDDYNPYPYELKVDYTAIDDNLEVLIEYSGKDQPLKQDAPKTGNTLTFILDYAGDTTGEDIRAVLRDKTHTDDVKNTDSRYRLTFYGEGMMMANAFKLKAPKDAKKAVKAKKAGGPITKGYHSECFKGKPFDAPHLTYSARMWIQGKFSNSPTLRTEYDLPVGVGWLPGKDGEWYPCWGKLLLEDLKAEPVKPGGEVPITVVRVALLDHKGKVVRLMTYDH